MVCDRYPFVLERYLVGTAAGLVAVLQSYSMTYIRRTVDVYN